MRVPAHHSLTSTRRLRVEKEELVEFLTKRNDRDMSPLWAAASNYRRGGTSDKPIFLPLEGRCETS